MYDRSPYSRVNQAMSEGQGLSVMHNPIISSDAIQRPLQSIRHAYSGNDECATFEIFAVK
jgi:hypothetical protein